jgi:hypothetical protein
VKSYLHEKTDRSKEISRKNEIFKITQIQFCSQGSKESLKSEKKNGDAVSFCGSRQKQ